jgi:hypothetical protein
VAGNGRAYFFARPPIATARCSASSRTCAFKWIAISGASQRRAAGIEELESGAFGSN